MADVGVPVSAHRDRILELVSPLAPVIVALGDALGLVCAVDVPATISLPRFDHAAMDGYAVRAADVAASPVELPVAGVVAAGDAAQVTLAPGTAWRIMTGAPVPDGADAVVPFEWTDRGADRVRIDQAVPVARHIRRTGEDVPEGVLAVAAGTALAPRHLALLAAVGVVDVAVHPAPRVAVIATGEEIAGPADLPGHVPDSNTVALSAAARAAGARETSYGPVPDDPALLLDQVATAAEAADLVVTTGGVSAGDHDVVKAALCDREGFWFGSVAVKPGRPQGCGLVIASDGRQVPVVALPGTPVAAYSSFRLFAEPALRALAGRFPEPTGRAVLDAEVAVAGDRTLVLPAAYVAPGRVAQLPGHVGHSQRLLADADVLLVLPPGSAPLPAGDEVGILPLGSGDR
ncbi:molybdopterin molybdotransferase MoeA [Nocardioides antri]|uniref:Molybdopterin molybdenumtransferase n=1 Tax=Nocardioides antri TaxID=2607659 RepID=A0A5B1M5C5_9ACTN|nr:gephyrin-like molybdotransferase Glp [Nocardioides antri]KAA1428485.1 molybdopterin molybdotransferase MoeA [Nocardioides antri]